VDAEIDELPEGPRRFFREKIEAYDELHYGTGRSTLMTARLARLLERVEALELPAAARVLEVGCGPGHLVTALAEQGLEAWAADTSRGMLRASEARLRARGLPAARLVLGSIEALPWASAQFDLVCSAGVIEYLESDQPALAELHRVLRPGGELLLAATNAGTPALAFDAVVEALKRRAWLRRPLNRLLARAGQPALRPRYCRVRRHRAGDLSASLARLGFRVREPSYFHLLPWPRPFDRVLPRTTAALLRRLEPLARTSVGRLAEGFLLSARKQA
jgi:ubiquinone/menaquinone biosynthesis C-methylase UbiE